MSALVPFDFEDHAVRTVDVDGQWWFVAADVCRVLEIRNNRDAVEKLDPHQVSTIDLNTVGSTDSILGNTVTSSYGIQAPRRGNPNASVVSEGGLYKLIFRSKQAVTPGTVQHRFANWVVDNLLPALRKYGTYSLTDRNRLAAKRMHYAALPGKVQDIAAQRREAIEQVNAAVAEGARIGDAVAAAAEAMGVSCRTIRRWRDVTYMVADPDLEVALAPKWQHGPRGMMAECHPAALARYLDLVGRGLRYATAFARVRQEADVHGWGPLPHPKTMRVEAKRVFPQLNQSPKVKSIQ